MRISFRSRARGVAGALAVVLGAALAAGSLPGAASAASYDSGVPAAPTISSVEYPASDPADPNDPWYDGVGRPGTFTFDSPSTDVVRYWYGFNSDPIHEVATSGGDPVSVQLVPTHAGLNFVTARAFDQEGHGSEPRTYMFSVASGPQVPAPRQKVAARWKLDTVDATAPATSPDDSGTTNALTLSGGAKLGTGFMESGLELDGSSDYASTSTVPVDTSTSFTVTAWAQAAVTPGQEATVVSAEGDTQSAFAIKFVPDAAHPGGLGSWAVDLPEADTGAAAVTRVSNSVFTDVREWNHLALVYDAVAKRASLYVNGTLQEIVCEGANDDPGCVDRIAWADDVSVFKADTSFQVGRAKTDGAWGSYFPGVVDDVWAFEGALTERQVQELAGSWFDVPTRVPSG